MKKLLMISILILMALNFNTAFASDTIDVPSDIRVGIYYSSKAKSQVTLSSPGGLKIGTMSDGCFEYEYEAKPNQEVIIKKGNKNGAVSVEGFGVIGNDSEYPYFKSMEDDEGKCLISIDGTLYRGNVEIRRLEDSDMTVINHVSMQEYLYGVVPREIGGNSAIEAVKAQAIVARTYAAKNYGRRSKLGFDVMPTVDDQAYGGYEWENKNSNKAVDETDGQVVVYDGKLIGGFYFSTSGGYTEDVVNVWGGKYDYLKAVPDTYEPVIEGNTTWEVTKTADEIKASLSKNGINVGDIIDLIPEEYTEAGRVLKLKIVGTKGVDYLTKSNTRGFLGLKSQWYSINTVAPQVGEGNPNDVKKEDEDELTVNKVSTIKVEKKKDIAEEENRWWEDDNVTSNSGEQKPVELVKEVNYNQDVSKYTKEYVEKVEEIIDVEKESGEEYIVVSASKTSSNIDNLLKGIVDVLNLFGSNKKHELKKEVKYEASSNKTTFTFRGRGWGHAVGMSQNGAIGMAKNGFTAEEIIKWYYSGVQIAK